MPSVIIELVIAGIRRRIQGAAGDLRGCKSGSRRVESAQVIFEAARFGRASSERCHSVVSPGRHGCARRKPSVERALQSGHRQRWHGVRGRSTRVGQSAVVALADFAGTRPEVGGEVSVRRQIATAGQSGTGGDGARSRCQPGEVLVARGGCFLVSVPAPWSLVRSSRGGVADGVPVEVEVAAAAGGVLDDVGEVRRRTRRRRPSPPHSWGDGGVVVVGGDRPAAVTRAAAAILVVVTEPSNRCARIG